MSTSHQCSCPSVQCGTEHSAAAIVPCRHCLWACSCKWSVRLQDVLIESHGNEEDPTAALLRGAECNVCMNRPVQVMCASAPDMHLHTVYADVVMFLEHACRQQGLSASNHRFCRCCCLARDSDRCRGAAGIVCRMSQLCGCDAGCGNPMWPCLHVPALQPQIAAMPSLQERYCASSAFILGRMIFFGCCARMNGSVWY